MRVHPGRSETHQGEGSLRPQFTETCRVQMFVSPHYGGVANSLPSSFGGFLPFKGLNHVVLNNYVYSPTHLGWHCLDSRVTEQTQFTYSSTRRGSSSYSVAIGCGTIPGFGITSAIDLQKMSRSSYMLVCSKKLPECEIRFSKGTQRENLLWTMN